MTIQYRFAVPPEIRKFDRRKVEAAIDKLIMLLDLTDPDPDLEDDTPCEDVDDDTAVDDRGCDEECYV
jgi:hypothetical protein